MHSIVYARARMHVHACSRARARAFDRAGAAIRAVSREGEGPRRQVGRRIGAVMHSALAAAGWPGYVTTRAQA